MPWTKKKSVCVHKRTPALSDDDDDDDSDTLDTLATTEQGSVIPRNC